MARAPRKPVDPWEAALAALARRALTEAEIRRKLSRKGVPDAAIDEVLARLRRLRYVDDREVAYNHAARRAREGRRGPLRVFRELLARGIDGELAREAVDAAYPREEDRERARAALSRLSPGGVPRDPAERARLFRKMIRQGFAAGEVRALLDEVDDDGIP